MQDERKPNQLVLNNIKHFVVVLFFIKNKRYSEPEDLRLLPKLAPSVTHRPNQKPARLFLTQFSLSLSFQGFFRYFAQQFYITSYSLQCNHINYIYRVQLTIFEEHGFTYPSSAQIFATVYNIARPLSIIECYLHGEFNS